MIEKNQIILWEVLGPTQTSIIITEGALTQAFQSSFWRLLWV
jgi:hypothetical protein